MGSARVIRLRNLPLARSQSSGVRGVGRGPLSCAMERPADDRADHASSTGPTRPPASRPTRPSPTDDTTEVRALTRAPSPINDSVDDLVFPDPTVPTFSTTYCPTGDG